MATMAPQNATYSVYTTALLIVGWWSTAVMGTLYNKKVMKQFPYPIAFTSLHLLMGTLFDYIVITISNQTNLQLDTKLTPATTTKPPVYSFRESSIHRLKFHYEYFKICAVYGLFYAAAKFLTQLSYQHATVSLTHSIKSMSPVFTVMATILIFRRSVPLAEILAIIPIIVGVIMCTMTELEFEYLGFLAALSSTMVAVGETIASKYVLTYHKHNAVQFIISPMELDMYGSILGLVFLVPFAMYSEGITDMEQMKNVEIPYYFIAMSGIWLYVKTMFSLFLLKRISTVTHNVLSVFKRFWIIIISIVYFGQQTTIYNYIGILLGLTGFYCYQRVNKNKKNAKLRMSPTRSDYSLDTSIHSVT
mmetsp:Transcript_33758/g.54013  ORF Transcript_33758/g.54013 Transcript_33758/m.54013 type:complete len:362 (-) Transcript_33758:88-1173(-)